MRDSTTDERSGDEEQPNTPDETGAETGEPTKKKRRRRRRRSRSEQPKAQESTGTPAGEKSDDDAGDDDTLDDPKPVKVRAAPPQVASDPEVFAVDKTFADIGLHDDLLQAVEEAGFIHPTHIQHQLIPPALKGGDILGQAKTGTGKTAAFGLPVLQMAEKGTPFQALILSPTRELAIQIRDGLRDLASQTGLKLTAVYGGQRMHTQIQELERGPEIIVGTPGRIMDMVGRGHLRLDKIRFAVLDEVDRMLDIGFREDIRKILGMCPKQRQTMMVSATLSPEIEDLARRYMNNPDKIVTTSGSLTVKIVQQHYLTVEPWDKKKLLCHLLTHEEPALTLVFCRLKRTVDDLDRYLRKHGIDCHAIHGDLRQSRREQVIKEMRTGGLEVLIASDLAARGLDVVGISHVINFDLPEDPDLYVHRIGRTARAGRGGIAWSFVTPQQGKLLTHIERLINAQIDRLEYPDFEGTERPENWRDDTPTRPIAKVDAPPPVNRMAGPSIPTSKPRDAKEQKKLDAKFPGGIVPTKLPPKRMHGRLSTGRGKG